MEPASSGISRLGGTAYGFGTIQVTSETVDWSQMWRFCNAFTLSVLHDVIIYDLHAWYTYVYIYICVCVYGLVQECSNSIANVLELLQCCTKPSIY